MPVDGSAFAARALRPTSVLAGRLNAAVTVVGDSDLTHADAVLESAVVIASGGGQVPDSVTAAAVVAGLRNWLEDRPTGLLAISSHSRPHRAEEPIGHTALQIIHHSPIPVLVVALAAAPEGQRRHPRVTTAPG